MYQGMLGTHLYPLSNIPVPSTNLTNGAFGIFYAAVLIAVQLDSASGSFERYRAYTCNVPQENGEAAGIPTPPPLLLLPRFLSK